MKNKPLHLAGAWPVLPTPYAPEMKIDLPAYHAMLEWYLAHGVGGLYANCLSSEMHLLSPSERLLLISEAARAAAGRVPVAATGNLGETLEEDIALCNQAAKAGADVVMLVAPPWLDEEADLEWYYLTLACRVEAPLGLYECPHPRAYHLSPALVGRLAHSGRFHAYKETSGELARIQAHLEATDGTPLALLHANTPLLLESVRLGASGAMSIAANWLPDLVGEVIAAGRSGDPQADRLQARLCMLEMVERAAHPLAVKFFLARRGLPVKMRTRSDAPPLDGEVLRALEICAQAWFHPDGSLRESPVV